MSKPAEAACETTGEPLSRATKPGWKLSLDDFTKLLGVAAVIVGVGKYFYDKVDAAAQDAQARSISYIETWGTEPLLGGREALYDFWAAQPDLIAVFGTESISARQYKTMLSASLFRNDADAAIRAPLLLLDNFYSQMSFCSKSELCDRRILDAYFCHMTRKNAVAYTPFYDRIRIATGDQGIGEEMMVFAQSCPSEKAS